MTYTIMDIPYWSMIPSLSKNKESMSSTKHFCSVGILKDNRTISGSCVGSTSMV